MQCNERLLPALWPDLMSPAAALVARIPCHSFASPDDESQLGPRSSVGEIAITAQTDKVGTARCAVRTPQRGVPTVQLETERLMLRSFGREDVEAMAQLFANPDFMRFSLGAFTERKKTVEFIEKVMDWDLAGMPSQFAVLSRGEHAVIGYCGFLHHPEVPGEVELGYRLHPDYWNRGLITEAARAVRDHGFADLKLPRVISLIHPENIPSRRVAEKNGMNVEKEIRFRGFPALVYAITREQWLANRDAL
jgi:RimJ/RimL family protein N-acetyltransferase